MESRRLHRSRTDRWIGGVCGGISEYLNLDPTIVRLLTVILTILGSGTVVVVYIVMWFIVPEDEQGDLTNGVPSPAAEDVSAAYETTETAYTPPPAPQVAPVVSSGKVEKGVRGGLVWFGVVLVMFGVLLVAGQMLPDLGLWRVWPATLLGAIFIVQGVHKIVTPGSGE